MAEATRQRVVSGRYHPAESRAERVRALIVKAEVEMEIESDRMDVCWIYCLLHEASACHTRQTSSSAF